MPRGCTALILTTLALLAAGCTSAQFTAAWAQRHGGVLPSADLRQTRVAAVSQPLTSACVGRKLTVQILATDVVTAYSLWNGRVYVTRGLLDRLNDAELQAAIAHELGHLLSDGHVQTVASLRGRCVDPDREVRADAVGVALLRDRGLSPAAMISMLQKVARYGSLPPACYAAVTHRISLLDARTPSLNTAQN